MVRLRQIKIYPIKSVPGIELSAHSVVETGLLWDRHWMLTDGLGNFITQREEPILNTLQVSQINNGFKIKPLKDDRNELILPLGVAQNNGTRPVKIWGSEFQAIRTKTDASEWFSDFLHKKVELVQINPGARMKKNSLWPRAFPLSFTDGYPIHLINLASVEDISKQSGETIHPDQFRANLVVEGLEPYEEDEILTIRLDDLELAAVKKCDRCIMTGIRPERSEIGKEPLKTLSTYRRSGNSVNFGIYLIPKGMHPHSGTEVSIFSKMECQFSKK